MITPSREKKKKRKGKEKKRKDKSPTTKSFFSHLLNFQLQAESLDCCSKPSLSLHTLLLLLQLLFIHTNRTRGLVYRTRDTAAILGLGPLLYILYYSSIEGNGHRRRSLVNINFRSCSEILPVDLLRSRWPRLNTSAESPLWEPTPSVIPISSPFLFRVSIHHANPPSPR